MKRLSLAIVFVCCTLAVAAQGDGFRVNYQGAKPTIKDFALAYIASLISEAEECDEEGMSLYENLQDAIKFKPRDCHSKQTEHLPSTRRTASSSMSINIVNTSAG